MVLRKGSPGEIERADVKIRGWGMDWVKLTEVSDSGADGWEKALASMGRLFRVPVPASTAIQSTSIVDGRGSLVMLAVTSIPLEVA